MVYTTLARIRAHEPCTNGWRKLLAYLGKTGPDDEPLPLLTVLESNGLDDALWCLRATDAEREARLFAVFCARQVQHLAPGSEAVLDVIERYAHGQVTSQDLAAARDAAWAATWDTARDAAWAATWDTARAAAWDAAWSATWDSAWDAAWDAARAAAWGAARAAAWDAAWSAAWGAARAPQEAEFRRILNF